MILILQFSTVMVLYVVDPRTLFTAGVLSVFALNKQLQNDFSGRSFSSQSDRQRERN